MPHIRLAEYDDLPAILMISNHYVVNSTCNFAIEPETLETWETDWERTQEMYPWFVAVGSSIPLPSEGGGQEGGGGDENADASTHPLVPSGGSLAGRGKEGDPHPRPLSGGSRGERGEEEDPHPQPLCQGERGVIIGFAKAVPYHGRCAYAFAVEITVYVHPDHHGNRIGKALYGRLLSTLRAQGYHAVIAAIAQPNPISVRLHESVGLSHAGTFRQVGRKFDRWHDVGYWYATLQDDDHEPGAIRPVRDVVPDEAMSD